jgi:hypothetical protein
LIFLNIILVTITLIVFLAAFGIVFAYSTGHELRSYPVLPPEAQVEIAGKTLSVSELALAYQPLMNLRKNNPSPPLLWTWYEAAKTASGVDLVYYQVWGDEIHPDPFNHGLYRIFRWAYYGSLLRDIEYFQISLSASNGAVREMLFETSPGDDYFIAFSQHLAARYRRRPDGLFDATLGNPSSGLEVSHLSGVAPLFDRGHVRVLAQTWNHLTRLLTASDSNLIRLSTQLKFLTAEEYAAFKFVRKSQGDHKTRENPCTRRIASLANLILLPGTIYLRFRFGRKEVQ